MTPVQAMLGIAGIVVALTVAERAAPARPPLPNALPALEHLRKQVARLDPFAYAVPAGLGCRAACELGAKRIRFHAGEALCDCRLLTAIGVHRMPRAARFETVVGPTGPVIADAGGAP